MNILTKSILTLTALAATGLHAEVFPIAEDTFGTIAKGTILKASGAAKSVTVSAKTKAYIGFDVGGSGIPASAVTHARLTVYVARATKTGNLNLANALGAFSETFADKSIPMPTDAIITTTALTDASSREYVTFDVTNQVKGWLTTPSSEHGFVLTADGTLAITIATKEGAGTGHPAILEVDVNRGGGPVAGTSASFSGTVSGSFSGNGAELTNLNGASLTTGSVGGIQLATGAVTAAKLGADVGLWSVSGANVFRSAGNVGIGTATPSQPLSVAGNIYLGTGDNSALAFDGDGFGRFGFVKKSGEHPVIASAVGGAVIFAQTDQDNVLTNVSGSTLTETMRVHSNGNVGIGTEAPDAALHVVTQNAGGGNNTAAFSAPNIGVHQSHIHFGSTGDWIIRSASSTGNVVMQDTGGNVGIGTGTPNSKLTVNGEIETLTGGVKFPDGSVQTKAAPGTGATSQFLSIGPGGFIATDSNNRVVSNFLDGTWATGGELIASVQLPSGAEVLSMTAYVHDTSATANLNVRLVRKISTGANTNGTTFDFDVAAGTVGYFNQTQAGSHIIDGTRGYFLRVFPVGGTWPGNNTLAVNNVVIEWRMP